MIMMRIQRLVQHKLQLEEKRLSFENRFIAFDWDERWGDEVLIGLRWKSASINLKPCEAVYSRIQQTLLQAAVVWLYGWW